MKDESTPVMHADSGVTKPVLICVHRTQQKSNQPFWWHERLAIRLRNWNRIVLAFAIVAGVCLMIAPFHVAAAAGAVCFGLATLILFAIKVWIEKDETARWSFLNQANDRASAESAGLDFGPCRR